MSYKLKTTEENGQYTGYIIDGEQIVYKTEPQATPNLASILLTKYLNEQAQNARFSTQQQTSQAVAPSNNTTPQSQQPAAPEPPRRCCGRG